MQSERHHCPPHLRKFVLLSAILASAMGFIAFSIVAVALPQIRSSLGADFAQAQWVSNAYMLFLSALILIGGALGDRFGLRTVLSVGTGIFTIASLVEPYNLPWFRSHSAGKYSPHMYNWFIDCHLSLFTGYFLSAYRKVSDPGLWIV